MSPSAPASNSSAHVARRSSEPGLVVLHVSQTPLLAEKPPLELKRTESPDMVAPQTWGSPDYRGMSLSVSDLGGVNLDLVASFLPQVEFKDLATAVPAFNSARLMSGVVEAQTRIDIAEHQQLAAHDQVTDAEDDLRDLGERSLCRETRPAMALSAVGIGVGGGFVGLAVHASGGTGAMVLGGVFLGVGGVSGLCGALGCVRWAYQRRCAHQALSTGQHALAAARDEEALVREEILPKRIARLRNADLELGEHLPHRDEMPTEIDGLLPPRPSQ